MNCPPLACSPGTERGHIPKMNMAELRFLYCISNYPYGVAQDCARLTHNFLEIGYFARSFNISLGPHGICGIGLQPQKAFLIRKLTSRALMLGDQDRTRHYWIRYQTVRRVNQSLKIFHLIYIALITKSPRLFPLPQIPISEKLYPPSPPVHIVDRSDRLLIPLK
jgi:hypothetical protein